MNKSSERTFTKETEREKVRKERKGGGKEGREREVEREERDNVLARSLIQDQLSAASDLLSKPNFSRSARVSRGSSRDWAT